VKAKSFFDDTNLIKHSNCEVTDSLSLIAKMTCVLKSQHLADSEVITVGMPQV